MQAMVETTAMGGTEMVVRAKANAVCTTQGGV